MVKLCAEARLRPPLSPLSRRVHVLARGERGASVYCPGRRIYSGTGEEPDPSEAKGKYGNDSKTEERFVMERRCSLFGES